MQTPLGNRHGLSIVTLTTLGYGGITPEADMAR
jgi:hypothetical protein